MNNQQQPINPTTCPVCGSTKLTYKTEGHKELASRILNAILLPLIFIFTLIGVIKMLTFDYSNFNKVPLPSNYHYNLVIDSGALLYFILAGVALLIFICLQINIYVTKSKTQVCAVCSDCGNIWNLN